MYSTQSTSHSGQNEPRTGRALGKSSGQPQDVLALVKPHKASLEADDAARPQTAQTEIHSPTPKRSMSSPSHRERFSNILSIDEGVVELDEFTQGSKRLTKASITSLFAKNRSSTGRSDAIHRMPATQYTSPTLQNISEAQPLTPSAERSGEEATIDQHRAEDAAPREFIESHEHSPRLGRVSSTTCRQKALKMSRSAINLLGGPGSPSLSSQLNEGSASRSQTSSSMERYGKPHTMKELPLRPRSSVVSIAPPRREDPAALPFSFTPLRPEERDHDGESVAELGRLAASYLHQAERSDRDPTSILPKMTSTGRTDQVPFASSLATNSKETKGEYGKTEGSPKSDPETPAPARESIDPNLSPSKQPRFKLKVHRASSSSARATKITKSRPSAEPETQLSKESRPVCLPRLLRVELFTDLYPFSNERPQPPLDPSRSLSVPDTSHPSYLLRTTAADRTQSEPGSSNRSTYHHNLFQL